MIQMLLLALCLVRKGATLFCYFGHDPGSVDPDSWRQRGSLIIIVLFAIICKVVPSESPHHLNTGCKQAMVSISTAAVCQALCTPAHTYHEVFLKQANKLK